jgi:hypothetical protein
MLRSEFIRFMGVAFASLFVKPERPPKPPRRPVKTVPVTITIVES